jgi:DNA-directed RNA polymerase subunit RPC12/RpoP
LREAALMVSIILDAPRCEKCRKGMIARTWDIQTKQYLYRCLECGRVVG